MAMRIAMFAAAALLLTSSAWATTSSCGLSSLGSAGCITTSAQFVNIFTVTNANTSGLNPIVNAPVQNMLSAQPVNTALALSGTFNDTASTGFAGTPPLVFQTSTTAGASSGFSSSFSSASVANLFSAPQSSGDGNFVYTTHCVVLCSASGTTVPVYEVSWIGSGSSAMNFSRTTAAPFLTTTSSFPTQTVFGPHMPEPATFGLMGGALAILALFLFRRKRVPA